MVVACQCHYHRLTRCEGSRQNRREPDLKDGFFRAAANRGDSPSSLLRSLMQQAVNEQEGRLGALEEWRRSVNVILLELLSVTQRSAPLTDEETIWENYKRSTLPEYLDEMITDNLEDRNAKGNEYWRDYWKEVDRNWFTNFSESPPVPGVHLQRDTMEELRQQIQHELDAEDDSSEIGGS